MGTRTLKVAAVVGGVVALAIGLEMAGGGGKPSARAPGPSHGGTPAPKAVASGPADTAAARPCGAVSIRGKAAASAASPAPPAESESVVRARDLLQRLRLAIGPTAEIPSDLRRDLLAFLGEGAENRASLFRLAWEPSMPRSVVGHLRLLIETVPDAALRETLLAAYEAFDPGAALRAEIADKSRDASGFAAELRAMPGGKDRLDRIANLPKETAAEPDVAEMLLGIARDDADEAVRGAAYNRLAYAGVPEVVPVLVAAAGDDRRSVRERVIAASSIMLHPRKPAPAELRRLYDDAPEKVRTCLLSSIAGGPSDRDVDDLLLEALVAEGSGVELRKAASNALAVRIFRLPPAEAEDLGSRVAAAVRRLAPETAAIALKFLGNVVCRNQPLRETIVDLHRHAPAGGAIQLAIAASPALRSVAGL